MGAGGILDQTTLAGSRIALDDSGLLKSMRMRKGGGGV